jgi:type I restriction enzyme R subunit
MTTGRPTESERGTRRQRVDPRLAAWGWTIVPFDPAKPLARYEHHAIEEYPTANGPADYGLVVDGQLLGVVEAKKVTLGPQNVLTQAERYSKGVDGTSLNFSSYRVPFLYSTNGEVFWFQDVRNRLNRSRKVAGFHTPEALREMLARDPETECGWFQQNPNQHPRLRPYQIDANTAIEQAIAGLKRQMLVAMATGTGKTFTLVNEVYRLLESGVAKRILFLVDRRVLAAQAVRAFASFEPEPSKKFDKIYEVYSQRFQRDDLEDEKFDPKVLPKSYLEAPQPKHAFVYVCTIQRMAINLFGRQAVWGGDEDIEDDAEQLRIPHHAFDVVIADECHRGYTTAEESAWRNTLDHFDAVKIGLTATPAAHTTAYFHDVVYRYEYARAVREIRGATRPGINGPILKEVLVPTPPPSEQGEIVRRVEELCALADRIDERVAKASAGMDQLTASLLAKAFRGELVPTEAEVAKREGRSYEPASVLLERIKQARSVATRQKDLRRRSEHKKKRTQKPPRSLRPQPTSA